MDGYIRIFGGRSNGELNRKSPVVNIMCIKKMRAVNQADTHGMPLVPGQFGDLNKEPLASDIFEARLDDAQFHGT